MKKTRTKPEAANPATLPRGRASRALPIMAIAVCGASLPNNWSGGSAWAFAHYDLRAGLRTPGNQSLLPPLLPVTDSSNSGFMVMDVSGPQGEPLPLRVVLSPVPKATYSFLMFQGLPPDFRLSAGFATKNQWAVSLNDVSGLAIIPPEGYSGAFSLDVLLVKGKDVEPERRTIKIAFVAPVPNLPSVSASSANEDTAPTSTVVAQVLTANRSDDQAEPAPKPIPPSQISDDDRLMIERGDLLFKQGDVAAARLIYHRMAKKGIAEAALAMARTYDPEALKTLRVEGLQPDIGQARVWYKMADELGSSQARNRLLTLRNGH